MTSKLHIGIVSWSIFENKGGLEQVSINLAHAMLERGHKITIFFGKENNNQRKNLFSISSEINLLALKLQEYKAVNTQTKVAEDLRIMQDTIVKSNIDVLTAMFSWDALMLFPSIMCNTGIPLIISEHSNPYFINNERWNSYEHYACLAAADTIHVLTSSYKEALPEFLQDRTTILPNAIKILSENEVIKPIKEEKIILAAGKFIDSYKQFSILFESFAIINKLFPEWRLVVCGDGPDKNNYKRLIKKLGIAHNVSLPGMVNDMSPYYASSAIVCVPSRYEGFPMVALEAYKYSRPVVGFISCSGLNNIVIHDETGLLSAENTALSLAGQLSKLMYDAKLRQQLGHQGLISLSRFSEHDIYSSWERIFKNTSLAKGKTRLQQLQQPQTEEELVNMALCEILSRPAPFARHNAREFYEIIQQRNNMKIINIIKNNIKNSHLPYINIIYNICSQIYKKISNFLYVLINYINNYKLQSK
jgi:glycosyltransferase involved in cell wall biosynthesis